MAPNFPLFSNPIHLAHLFWLNLIKKDDIVIDATVGNGKDILFLASTLMNLGGGSIYGLDIQKQAIETTHELLKEHAERFLPHTRLIHASHESFPREILQGSVKLIVYNLGYLPGGDKTITTMTESTIISIKSSLELICPGGAISITCYPGHEEGHKEFLALTTLLTTLAKSKFCVTSHTWMNRQNSPLLLFIQKST
ncbi:MAG: 16S rRNA (cytosine(1402)-N(4))-methyltransferase [Chlamydiae bacterium]|nr:16S rRNA (cytosine(1402)-N(4))-methyltransferase [Chlamydiota bacterium]